MRQESFETTIRLALPRSSIDNSAKVCPKSSLAKVAPVIVAISPRRCFLFSPNNGLFTATQFR